MRFSNTFTSAELTELQDSAVSWTTHAGGGTTTFITSSTASGQLVTERSGVSDLDSLMDGTFAVYKATTWHSDLPSTALAVTQIFGIRRNTGGANEYVEIVEGDILVNYDDYTFAPTTVNGYDLFTVLLHEYGHFLGMAHTYNFSSIMYPSIGSSTVYTAPASTDVSTLRSKYSLSGSSGAGALGAAIALRPEAEVAGTREEVNNSDQGVRIVLELHTNGECLHKIDGALVGTHTVKLK